MRKFLAASLLLTAITLPTYAGDTPMPDDPPVPVCQVDCTPPSPLNEPEPGAEGSDDTTLALTELLLLIVGASLP